jgi:hypothetical protein
LGILILLIINRDTTARAITVNINPRLCDPIDKSAIKAPARVYGMPIKILRFSGH